MNRNKRRRDGQANPSLSPPSNFRTPLLHSEATIQRALEEVRLDFSRAIGVFGDTVYATRDPDLSWVERYRARPQQQAKLHEACVTFARAVRGYQCGREWRLWTTRETSDLQERYHRGLATLSILQLRPLECTCGHPFSRTPPVLSLRGVNVWGPPPAHTAASNEATGPAVSATGEATPSPRAPTEVSSPPTSGPSTPTSPGLREAPTPLLDEVASEADLDFSLDVDPFSF